MGVVRTNALMTGSGSGSGGANGADLPTHLSSISANGGNGFVTLTIGYANTNYVSGVQVNYKTGSYPASPSDGQSINVSGAAASIKVTGLTNKLTYYFRVFLFNEVDGVKYFQTDITNARVTCVPKAVEINGITPTEEGDGYMVITTSGSFTISAPENTRFVLVGGGSGGNGGNSSEWVGEDTFEHSQGKPGVSGTQSTAKIGSTTLTSIFVGPVLTKAGALACGGDGGKGGDDGAGDTGGSGGNGGIGGGNGGNGGSGYQYGGSGGTGGAGYIGGNGGNGGRSTRSYSGNGGAGGNGGGGNYWNYNDASKTSYGGDGGAGGNSGAYGGAGGHGGEGTLCGGNGGSGGNGDNTGGTGGNGGSVGGKGGSGGTGEKSNGKAGVNALGTATSTRPYFWKGKYGIGGNGGEGGKNGDESGGDNGSGGNGGNGGSYYEFITPTSLSNIYCTVSLGNGGAGGEGGTISHSSYNGKNGVAGTNGALVIEWTT